MTGPEAMFGPSEGHVTAMEQCDPHWDTPGLSDVTVYYIHWSCPAHNALLEIDSNIDHSSNIIYHFYLFLEHREDLISICL